MKKKIAVFASGAGTNAENLIRYFSENGLAEIALVVSNRGNAGVLERARSLGVPALVFPKDDWSAGDAVLTALQKYCIDFVVLAGFLLRIPDLLLHAYPNKIINIHPSLLPKYGGKGMYGDRVHEAVVAAGEKETGITIHYINGHYDKGDIIFQATCPVLAEDTPNDVARKVHQLEYEHYPRIVEEVVRTIL